jgi:hypothetical protein
MWTYKWHLELHKGVLTQNVSVGWGWYLLLLVAFGIFLGVLYAPELRRRNRRKKNR